MNIFMMILVAVFMVGFYMISSPSQRVPEQETEYAIRMSDLRSVAECAVAAHNAKIRGTSFQDICIEQNSVASQSVCMNASKRITECAIVSNRAPEYSYIITTTAPLQDGDYNNMLEILETNFPDAGTFGIFLDGKIMLGGISGAANVPDAIIDELELQNGQIVYMTQYEIPTTTNVITATTAANGQDVVCPIGTIKTYRFSRWQCIPFNTQTDCGGDMIWDSELQTCVADENKKPLCAEQQTAVLVDSVWECVNPFPEKACPSGMIARLNYSTLEWECVADPSVTNNIKKCETVTISPTFGIVGTTAGISSSSCTDCERAIINPDTCATTCVPDPTKITDPRCYGDTDACSGPNRAIYFGFPNASYAANVSEINGLRIPIDSSHSQNRKFNCLDCGDGEIDSEQSVPPYIAICK